MVATLVGSTLGHFRVDRLLGRGGMGAVYAALDQKLEREVALKVLSEEGDVRVQGKRLLREARLAAKLTHPNIATVYEVDELDDRLYIVMELLEGVSVRNILSKRNMSVDEAVSVARDVARALARAHASDVIHRDIKPENVFVTLPAPDTMLAKVLDFGLARELPRPNEEQTATTTSERWGTPGYVSPEQAHGHPIDVRTDIFSFGVVFYEMLAGIKPFRAENAVAVMLATTRLEPKPLHQINPAIPPEIEQIVRRCLMKDRRERFENGAALSAALEEFVRSSPGESRMANVLTSSASLPMITQDILMASPPGAPSENTSGPTDQSATIMMTTPNEAVPTLDEQRQEHMKLVAAIGAGVATALVIILVALSWISSSPSRRARALTAPPSASNITIINPAALAPRAPVAITELPTENEETPGIPAPPLPSANAYEVASAVAGVGEARGNPAAAVRAHTTGTAAHPRKKPDDCAEPFKVDAKGVKIPKLQCLGN